MNKLAVVAGIAAVAVLSGCKDPDYLKPRHPKAQDEVKQVEAAPAAEAEQTETVEVIVVEEEPSCTCPAGTVHKEPCKCGAKDCKCKVAAPEPETTLYIVQRGDTLSAISKRFNIKQAAIIELNGLTSDKIRIGQKIKLPGKIDVGEQKEPQVEPVKRGGANGGAKGGEVAPYTGATEEYVVQAGDTIGKIAYGHGINIRQLKQLNGLKSNTIRVGQKLKVPAGQAKVTTVVAKPAEPKPAAAPEPKPQAEAAAPAPEVQSEPEPVIDTIEPEQPVVEVATQDYVVAEGDDMAGIAIQFGVPSAKVRELNGLGESDTLKPGQIIKIPLEGM